MTWDVVVPALTLRQARGTPDLAATRAYAERAAATWVDRFILSGSTTEGGKASVEARAAVLDLWLTVTPAERLLACCWEPDDVRQAAIRGIAPMMTLRVSTRTHALDLLKGLPIGSFVYSHPMFGDVVFDDLLASASRARGHLPVGGKLAKVTADDITRIRGAAGREFRLWDGSARRMSASLAAGASGVVATPLCAFETELPPRETGALQPVVDAVQNVLDALPDRAAKTAELLRRASI